jgi:dimethylargininase
VNGTALVRAPSSRLSEGIVTHISRVPVDVALARAQHSAYAEALAGCGWKVRQVPAAEDCPDSVFVEDAVVVCEDLAVLARPGAPARRAEVAGVAAIAGSLGLRTARIHEPGTLEGGDVLQSGHTVYVGRGGLFPAVRPVEEEAGCHVVPLGADRVLIAASAPRTAGLLDDLGFSTVVVDISEFEKLEGCVTCLNVLLPPRHR